MVEVEVEIRAAEALDHLIEAREQRLVGNVLVVERRQHQHARDALGQRVAAEPQAVGQRAAAGADQDPARRQAGREHVVEQRDPLLDRERIGLARGAEDHQAVAALVQQPARVGDEAPGVGRQIGRHRRHHRAPHALQLVDRGRRAFREAARRHRRSPLAHAACRTGRRRMQVGAGARRGAGRPPVKTISVHRPGDLR